MKRSSLCLCSLLCVYHLYGSQEVPVNNRPVETRTTRVLGQAEGAIHTVTNTAGRMVMRTLGLAARYPRLTALVTTVAPFVFPRYRRFVRRQTGRVVNILTRRVEQWAQQRIYQWLLGPYDQRLDAAQQGLDEQRHILDGHTRTLAGLQVTIDAVHEDTQGLVKEQSSLHEQLLQIHQAMDENTDQIKAVAEQGVFVRHQVADLQEVAKTQGVQLTHISHQADETLKRLQEMGISFEELSEQVRKYDEQFLDGSLQSLEKFKLLEERLGDLSAEQKQLFVVYGDGFNARLDKLYALLETRNGHPIVRCGQQYSATVKQ